MSDIGSESISNGFTFYHGKTFVADIISERKNMSVYENEYISNLLNEAISIFHIQTNQLETDDIMVEIRLYDNNENDLMCGVRLCFNNGFMCEVGYMSPNGNIIVQAKYDHYFIDWRLDNLTTTTSEVWSLLKTIYENSPF